MTIPSKKNTTTEVLSCDIYCMKVTTGDRTSEYEPHERSMTSELAAEVYSGVTDRARKYQPFKDRSPDYALMAEDGLLGTKLTYNKGATLHSPFKNTVGICTYFFSYSTPDEADRRDIAERFKGDPNHKALLLRVPAGTRVKYGRGPHGSARVIGGRLAYGRVLMAETVEVLS